MLTLKLVLMFEPVKVCAFQNRTKRIP